jgi:phage tail sheath protein FI
MAQYLSPGVYIEEIDAGPQPIEGVSTSVCGAVGVTVRGPTDGKPVLCTSFAAYTGTFGGFWPVQTPQMVNKWSLNATDGGCWWQFPLAIKAFFDNGGQQIYVKRVFHTDLLNPSNSASAAVATLGEGLASALVADGRAGDGQLRLSHTIGLSSGTTVKIKQGDTGAQIGADIAIDSVDTVLNVVTFHPPLTQALSVKRGDYAEILAVSSTTASVGFTASARGTWGNDLWVRIEPMVGNTLNLLFDAALGPASPEFTTINGAAAVAAGITTIPVVTVALTSAPLAQGDHVMVGAAEYVISSVDAANHKIAVTGDALDDAMLGAVVKRLRKANDPGHTTAFNVWGASALYVGALVELATATMKENFTITGIAGNAVTLSGAPAQQYYEGYKLRVIEARVTVEYRPPNDAVTQEVFSNLQLQDASSPSYLVNLINVRSKLVTAASQGLGADLAHFPVADPAQSHQGVWMNLASGDDKLGLLTTDDFVGIDGGSGKRTGIQALEDIDDVSICIVPGMWAQDVHAGLIAHCESLKSRFAILDPPDGLDIAGIQAFRAPLESKYAALYHPWVVSRDPSIAQDVNLAPSGHMAGIYARVDNDRGVWKAPANEPVLGISKFAQDVTRREQDLINPIDINALRFFPDRGNLVWGARVVTSDSQWKYVNVRRLFIYIEQSIERGTQWVVFEPNDQALWARVRQSISNFLETTWRQGALMGSKASEAFFVKCDLTTMTQDDLDNGRLICLIGIAPVKPAEFVIFRIQQKTLDQTAP